MLRTALAVALLAGVAACTGAKAPAAPRIEAPKDVVGAAKATVEKWRLAYEGRNLDALSMIYPHDLDVVVIQEGVATQGWTAVEAMLKDRLAKATEIHVRIKDQQVVSLAPDAAATIATMTRELISGGTTINEAGTLSLILRKVGEAWVIAVEHYSYKRS
jgi:ketosteroid isomerase-like protein